MKFGNCLKAISTAAPLLNPRITAWETKFNRAPSRAIPMPICSAPTSSARRKTASR
jgi:hypothetical protein